MRFALCNFDPFKGISCKGQCRDAFFKNLKVKFVPRCHWAVLGGETAASMESPRDEKKQQKSMRLLVTREVRWPTGAEQKTKTGYPPVKRTNAH